MSLAHFDPTGFDLDIYGVEVTGLGRGKGVKVTGMYSILKPGDATIELIKDRILELSRILLENGCLKPDEVLSSLKIKTLSPREIHMLKSDVEVLEVELKDAERERDRLRVEVKTLEAGMEEVRERLRDVKGERDRLRVEVETLEAQLENAKRQPEEKGELNNVYEGIKEAMELIEETLGEGWSWDVNEEANPVEALKERLKDLIDEYETLEAEVE